MGVVRAYGRMLARLQRIEEGKQYNTGGLTVARTFGRRWSTRCSDTWRTQGRSFMVRWSRGRPERRKPKTKWSMDDWENHVADRVAEAA